MLTPAPFPPFEVKSPKTPSQHAAQPAANMDNYNLVDACIFKTRLISAPET